jgi:large repetitive protein
MGRGIGSPDLRAIASLGFVGASEPDLEEPVIADTDADGDGVQEPLDRCPAEVEDIDTFEDQDGCPDLDNDADGVLDTEDRCVGELEDRDGFEDVDGCPDTDNDADTVLDGSDQCPEQAEDVDTFQDTDGCPDADNDADGVLDADDACPMLAGTRENKGCAQVVVEGNQIRLTERIEFDKNGAEILPESEPILEQVRALLEQNPKIQAVAIEGHTDGTGAVAHNQTLSERRALSVVDWLARHGIAAERLTAHGCGNKRPLADESTEEGLRKNRRVELHIVEGAERAAIKGCVNVPYSPSRPVEAR